MARRLIDCVGKAVKAGRLNENEAALLLQRTERFAHLTKEQAELNAANSVLTEQMTELSNLEKQVGPPGKAEVVYKSKDKDEAVAMMFHEAQVVTDNKMLAKKREVEGEGAIKTQRQVAVEQEIEAVIKGPAPPPATGKPKAAPGEPKGEKAEAKPSEPKASPVEKRLQIYGTIKEKLTGLIARHAAEIQKLEFEAGLTIGASEGLTAEEIATQEIDKSKLGEIDKAKLLSALGELDALLKYVPAEVRGRVGGFYQLAKGTMGEKTLTEFFTKRIRMVEREFERVLVAEYREAFEDLFKSTKPKRGENRVRKSTLGPDVQDEVDAALRASTMTREQTSASLDAIERALEAEDLLPEQRADLLEEYAIVNGFGDLQHRNAEDLASAYEWLAGEAKSGRLQWRAKEEARLAKHQRYVEQTVAGMPEWGNRGLAKVAAKEMASLGNAFLLSHYSVQQFLDYILPETATYKSEWSRRARIADQTTQDQKLDAGNRLTATLQQVVGNKGRVAMAKEMWSLKEVHDGLVKKDKIRNGKKIGEEIIPMSKLHAVQYVLSWEQADVRDEKMKPDGWTEESVKAMRELIRDDKSQAVKAWLRGEYDKGYNLANAVYRRMHGMNMPKIEFYAPTYYENATADKDMSSFGSPVSVSGMTAGFLRQRVKHGDTMRHVDALTAYWQHSSQLYHWVNHAELLREMRGVLNHKDVRLSIKEQHGTPVSAAVNMWIDSLSRQGMNKAAELSWMTWLIDGVVGAKAVSTLGFSFKSISAQLDSALRWMYTVPLHRAMKAMIDPNFASNVAMAWKSDTAQRRVMSGGSPEARYLYEATMTRPSVLLELSRVSMVPMQWSDGRLTSLSAAIVYTDSYNEAIKGGSTVAQAEAIALDMMDESVYRGSQPIGVGSRSLLENVGNPLFKLFTLFMSDMRLKSALALEGATKIAKGDFRTGARMLVAIEAMALLAKTVENAYRDIFSDDDEEELWTLEGYLKAMMLVPLSGVFGINSVADAAYSRLLGERGFEPQRDPFFEGYKRVEKAFANWEDLFDTDDPTAMLREWEHIARGAALTGGLLGPGGAAPGVSVSVLLNILKPLVGATANVQKEE